MSKNRDRMLFFKYQEVCWRCFTGHAIIKSLKETISMGLYWLSRILFYIILKWRNLEILPIERMRFFHRNGSRNLNKLLHFILSNLEYHGFLKSDLERVVEFGKLRYEYSCKMIGRADEQKTCGHSSGLRIGFLGIWGREANFSKNFFKNSPDGTQIFLFDLIRYAGNYLGTDMFTGEPNITYQKTPALKPWWESTEQYDELAKKINDTQLDVLITACGHFCLPAFDNLICPNIIAFNTSSMLMPHPKCRVQTFVQPPWPYVEKNNYVVNIKTRKTITDCIVFSDTFAFNPRGVDTFKTKCIKDRKKQIFYSGNIKKITSPEFCTILIQLLKKNPNLKFIYYGHSDKRILPTFIHRLGKAGVLSQTLYKGTYTVKKNRNGQLINAGGAHTAFNDLINSRLVLNPFPISGARGPLEAYWARVPVIHLDLNSTLWLTSQKLQPFKLPMILTRAGSSGSLDEYYTKCQRVIDDDSFAKIIVEEQKNVIQNFEDIGFIWEKFMKMISTSFGWEEVNH